jgi:hypothetical protein
MSDIKNNNIKNNDAVAPLVEIIESKNFDAEASEYEKHMIETIQKYEEKHGEIVAETYNKIYVNKDDYYVWNMIPLTDIQKKYIFINIINGETSF